jgi:hypothetical protein
LFPQTLARAPRVGAFAFSEALIENARTLAQRDALERLRSVGPFLFRRAFTGTNEVRAELMGRCSTEKKMSNDPNQSGGQGRPGDDPDPIKPGDPGKPGQDIPYQDNPDRDNPGKGKPGQGNSDEGNPGQPNPGPKNPDQGGQRDR